MARLGALVLLAGAGAAQAFFGRKIDIPSPAAAPAVPCGDAECVPVGTVLGTMTYSAQTDLAGAEAQLRLFAGASAEALEVDSARMYVAGGTERMLGEILSTSCADLRPMLRIATKANAFPTHNHNLTAANLRAQLAESLGDMGADAVDIFYLHAPDRNTPLPETLAAVQGLYRKAKFREFGLSNYPAWQVVQIHAYMASRGWVLPTVYQGMYNAVTRDVEKELLPALRALGMRFYAYNPLAGGLLTGKYRSIDDLMGEGDGAGDINRFKGAGYGEWYGKMYQNRYWKQSYFDAIADLRLIAEPLGISLVDAAIRWMYHHSQLDGAQGDKVIIGGSKLHHLEENLKAAAAGPLPEDIAAAWEKAWAVAKPDCPPYFR